MEVKIEPEAEPVNFNNPEDAKNFIEKKFREFQTDKQARMRIEVRK